MWSSTNCKRQDDEGVVGEEDQVNGKNQDNGQGQESQVKDKTDSWMIHDSMFGFCFTTSWRKLHIHSSELLPPHIGGREYDDSRVQV